MFLALERDHHTVWVRLEPMWLASSTFFSGWEFASHDAISFEFLHFLWSIAYLSYLVWFIFKTASLSWLIPSIFALLRESSGAGVLAKRQDIAEHLRTYLCFYHALERTFDTLSGRIYQKALTNQVMSGWLSEAGLKRSRKEQSNIGLRVVVCWH